MPPTLDEGLHTRPIVAHPSQDGKKGQGWETGYPSNFRPELFPPCVDGLALL